MSKQEVLRSVLDNLRTAIPDLQGALIASTDGLPITHSFLNGVDPNRVAAMTATALGVGKRISESLSAGSFAEASIKGETGQIFLYSAGSKAVLAVLAPQECNVGLIQMEARDAAAAIATTL